MSQDNHITLRGYLTAEPTLYQKTATTTPVTEIRVGSTPRRLNRETGEWYDAPASYFTVKCWRRLAINAASSLHKGDMVVVRGRFYMNHWVDGQQRQQSRLEIEADSLGHDLSYGWSHFLRGTRGQHERPADVNAGEMARQEVAQAGPDAGSSGQAAADDAATAYPGGFGRTAGADGEDDGRSAGDAPDESRDESSAMLASLVTDSDGDGGGEPDGAPAGSSLADDGTLAQGEREPAAATF